MLFILLRSIVRDTKLAFYFWNLKHTAIFDIFNILSGKVYIIASTAPFIAAAFLILRKKFFLFLITAILAVSVSDILCYRALKPGIKRLRPVYELQLNSEKIPESRKAYGMPSNHASNIFALFTVYLFMVRRFALFFFINALLIAFSRFVVVAHFLTDVLAGILLGSFIGLCFYHMAAAFENYFADDKNGGQT